MARPRRARAQERQHPHPTRSDTYTQLAIPANHSRSVFRVLEAADPSDEFSLVYLQPATPPPSAAEVLVALLAPDSVGFLVDVAPSGTPAGNDGDTLTPAALLGEEADPDDVTRPATGLRALGEVDDIAIVATPDTVRFGEDGRKIAVDNLIGHCEQLHYRIAIVDPPAESSISEGREFRSKFDTKYAALYYPWLEIVDPGHVRRPGIAGTEAAAAAVRRGRRDLRCSDVERGVHKAPANEVVLGITRFEHNVTTGQQAVLNLEGINALRFFEDRSVEFVSL